MINLICWIVDLEADISQLQAPTFTTINRGPPEPMLHLSWSLPVNLIGEKVLNPMIHCCDKCLKPILIYGRLVRLNWRRTSFLPAINQFLMKFTDSMQARILLGLWKARRASTLSEMPRESGTSGTNQSRYGVYVHTRWIALWKRWLSPNLFVAKRFTSAHQSSAS